MRRICWICNENHSFGAMFHGIRGLGSEVSIFRVFCTVEQTIWIICSWFTTKKQYNFISDIKIFIVVPIVFRCGDTVASKDDVRLDVSLIRKGEN